MVGGESMMKNDLSYTEAAKLLGVHRESVSNYVKRGLLKISNTNTKAVTLESVNNLLNNHSDLTNLAKEVDQMKDELLKEKDELALARQKVKDKIEYNKVKGITFQNIGYICDALLVYLDAFGDKLSEIEKKIMRAVFAHTDLAVIGDDIGLTENRIRELFHKSLRRLAYSGSASEYKEENQRLLQQILMKEDIIESLKLRLEHYKDKLHVESVMSGEDQAYVSVPKSWMQPIKAANFSVRTYNCLKVVDMEYVYELAFLSKYDYLRWRNFGRKSLNELELFKEKLNIPDYSIYDVRDINNISSADRIAVPLIILESKRRKWQKK